MLQTEFERLTGIYPDGTLYNAIEREYKSQTDDGRDIWVDKEHFCAAYVENRDGLAEKIQRNANNAIWKAEEKHRKAVIDAANRAKTLFEETHDIKVKMFDALVEAAVADDHSGDFVKHMIWGFGYLLDKLEEGK